MVNRIYLVFFVFLAANAFAEQPSFRNQAVPTLEEMQTDRPDFTEGTQTLHLGHFQIESGYTYSSDSGGGEKSHTLPEFLLRAGAGEEWELRFFWAGYLYESKGNESVDGVSDISLGIKHRLFEENGLLPTASLILESSIPVGNSEFSSEEMEPGGKFLYAYDLSQFALTGNLNLTSRAGEGDRYLEAAASLSLGTSLTEQLGSYLEYFGLYPTESVPESTEHYMNGGFTYALTPNLQLDLRAGFGMNTEATEFFSGAGVSFRR